MRESFELQDFLKMEFLFDSLFRPYVKMKMCVYPAPPAGSRATFRANFHRDIADPGPRTEKEAAWESCCA